MVDRKNIILYYLAAAVICLGVIIAFQHYTIRDRLTHQSRENMAGLAKSLSSGINEIIVSKADQFQRIADDPLFPYADLRQSWLYLQRIQKIQCPNTQLLFYGHDDGQCVTSTGSRMNFAGQEYTRALSGKVSVSDIRTSRLDREKVITIMVPVERDGEVKGVLGGNLRINAFLGAVKGTTFGQSGYALVVDSNGMVLSSPLPGQINSLQITRSGSPSLNQISKEILTQEKGFGRYWYKGIDKFVAWARVDGTGWTVMVTSPVEEFYGTSNSILKSAIAITCALFGLVVLLGLIIMNRHKVLQKHRYLSYHDALTGLYNRAYAEDSLNRFDSNEHLPLSIILGDVNGLKAVNDTLGHANGDKLLMKIARVLEESCRKEDIVSRWGGDEFIILSPNTDETTALSICDRIIQNCRKASEDFFIKLSISLGAAAKDRPEQELVDVIGKAEERMYHWKRKSGDERKSDFDLLKPLLWHRQPEDWGNFSQLKEITLELGRSLGLTEKDLAKLTLLVLLHDIGQVVVPQSILAKPGKLSPEEMDIIKKHPEIGSRVASLSPETQEIAREILAHHEWWDGSGYPLNLSGEEIPLLARIISIATAYNAMLSGRPYREPLSKIEALKEIQAKAGTQFDPQLVEAFLKVVKRAS